MLSQLGRNRLGEHPSLRGQQDDRGYLLALDILHRCEKRLRFHHHAAAAAIRGIVGRLVPVRRPVPRIVQVDSDQPAFLRPLENGSVERSGEHFGEDGDDVDAHTASHHSREHR